VNVLLITRCGLFSNGVRLVGCWLRQRELGQGLDVVRGKPEHSDGIGDILDGLFAQIGERKRRLASDLLIRRARDTQATRFTQCLQPSRDVDAITKDVIAVYYDVADIYADPEDYPLVVA
jgi:hypothetical protein